MAEDLDHLLALGELLHEAVDLAQVLLPAAEGPAGQHGDVLGGHHDDDHGHDHEARHGDGQGDHLDEHGHQGEAGGEQLGDEPGHKALEGIHVVRVVAHDVAVGVVVKVADGQGLHAGEEGVPDPLQGPLADGDHHQVLGQGGGDTAQVNERHAHHHAGQGRVVHRGHGDGTGPDGVQRGQQELVDHVPQEHGALHRHLGVGEDAAHHHQQQETMVEEILIILKMTILQVMELQQITNLLTNPTRVVENMVKMDLYQMLLMN